jgi:hypothetical protein
VQSCNNNKPTGNLKNIEDKIINIPRTIVEIKTINNT